MITELCPVPEESVGSVVIGREEEAEELMGRNRTLIIGESGIGKMMTVEKMAYLRKTKFRSLFPDRKIYCLNSGLLLADYNKPGNPDAVIDKLSSILSYVFVSEMVSQKYQPILYIKDIDLLFSIEIIRDFISQGQFRNSSPFIASISERNEENDELIRHLEKFNFTTMEIKENSKENVAKIVINHLGYHPVNPKFPARFTKGAIDLSVTLADKYIKTHPFPRKALNLVQECAVKVLMQDPDRTEGVVIQTDDIAEFVSEKTGIDKEDLLDETVFDKERFIRDFKKKIVGQDHAIEQVARCVAQYKQGMKASNKPIGVFLLVGPSGVGKTSFAEHLAVKLYRKKDALLHIAGEGLADESATNNLIGASLGFKGMEGGKLIPLQKDPHRVVLLDELEKANETVWNFFHTVFDRGVLYDNQGKKIDCSESVFLLTSNLFQEEVFLNPDNAELSAEEFKELIHNELKKVFGADFLNRVEIIPFVPIKEEDYPGAIISKMEEIKDRFAEQKDLYIEWTDDLIEHFTKIEFDKKYGMRRLTKTVDDTIKAGIEKVESKLKRPLKGKVLLHTSQGKIKIARGK